MSKIIIKRKFMSSLPRSQGTSIAKLLIYAGVTQSPEMWLGSRLLLAFTVGTICSFLPIMVSLLSNSDIGFGLPARFNIPFLILFMIASFVGAFGAVLALVYFHIYYVIHDRTRRIEDVLPDFLLMVAAQMHAGLTPFAAFQAAARPEFGPLEYEVKSIGSHSMGSESFTDALMMLTEHVDSPILRRTIAFFENGLKSGGRLASLLETAADEIRDLDEIRKETVLNTRTYTVFLVFILVGGLPVLLAISTEFLNIFTKMQAQVNTDSMKGVGSMLAPSLHISPEFVGHMAAVIIVGTSVLVSMFIGVIAEGKVLYGMKYSPILAAVAYGFYFLIKTVLSGFLGAFF